MPYYLDTSAFLKLVVLETETRALRAWFQSEPACWSSHLLATEAVRAAHRLGLSAAAVDVTLDAVSLVLPSAATFRHAAGLAPLELRSLDALHLATAIELGDDLEAVVTYDHRMIAGARSHGLRVLSPT